MCLHVCMHVCMYVCMYVWMCVSNFNHGRLCTRATSPECVCMYVCMCLYMFISECLLTVRLDAPFVKNEIVEAYVTLCIVKQTCVALCVVKQSMHSWFHHTSKQECAIHIHGTKPLWSCWCCQTRSQMRICMSTYL